MTDVKQPLPEQMLRLFEGFCPLDASRLDRHGCCSQCPGGGTVGVAWDIQRYGEALPGDDDLSSYMIRCYTRVEANGRSYQAIRMLGGSEIMRLRVLNPSIVLTRILNEALAMVHQGPGERLR